MKTKMKSLMLIFVYIAQLPKKAYNEDYDEEQGQ
jgi:hypothetical protein